MVLRAAVKNEAIVLDLYPCHQSRNNFRGGEWVGPMWDRYSTTVYGNQRASVPKRWHWENHKSQLLQRVSVI